MENNATTCTLWLYASELFEGKDGIMKHSHRVLFGSTVGLVLCLMGFEGRAEALSVTSLDFTSGAVNWDGRHVAKFLTVCSLRMETSRWSYQSMSDIVDPITRGHKTLSLFTSGLNGALPAAVGRALTAPRSPVDLSSLFGWTNGGSSGPGTRRHGDGGD